MKALAIVALTAAAALFTYRRTKPELGAVLVGAALIAAEVIAGIVALLIFT